MLIKSKIIPLLHNDVDTDQIIPARFLKVTDKAGLAQGLFSGWRYQADGSPNPDFPLNRPEYAGAQILMAGDNFGCGSSREHAPWAMAGWGLRVVISTSFADIFCSNAYKNGLLPLQLEPQAHQELQARLEADPELTAMVDLAVQELRLMDGWSAWFPIDAFNKTCLLEGLDQLGYILKFRKRIEAFERQRAAG
jgi:3-isopropylmalate/(R)-2-methylmalate dehydratase small subunit